MFQDECGDSDNPPHSPTPPTRILYVYHIHSLYMYIIPIIYIYILCISFVCIHHICTSLNLSINLCISIYLSIKLHGPWNSQLLLAGMESRAVNEPRICVCVFVCLYSRERKIRLKGRARTSLRSLTARVLACLRRQSTTLASLTSRFRESYETAMGSAYDRITNGVGRCKNTKKCTHVMLNTAGSTSNDAKKKTAAHASVRVREPGPDLKRRTLGRPWRLRCWSRIAAAAGVHFRAWGGL
jgi:hypothetical protein